MRTAPQRMLSVDVLRGVTVALMLLVNDPGDWGHLFRQLDHAEWNGWTLTDLVFPWFLTLMGASLVFSVEARRAKGNCKATLTAHVMARAAKIFALGLLLAYFPRMHWTTLRLWGVLPRIALVYAGAGLVVIFTRRLRWLGLIVAGLLVGYWVLLRWVPVPGLGMPGHDVAFTDKDANIVSWVDRAVSHWTLRWLHTGTLYRKTRDPEGLLSTLPAVASALVGSMAGVWMRRRREGMMQAELALAGVAAFCAGEVWARWFPVNKNLWTSSYVLVAGGLCLVLLGACSWLMDRGGREAWPAWLRRLSWPWLVFGSNPIVAFVLSIVVVKTMLYFRIADEDGDRHSLWALTYENVFARHGSTAWTSLAFAVCFVAVCFLPNWWLWRKKIFLRV